MPMTQCFLKNRRRLMGKHDNKRLWTNSDGTMEEVSDGIAENRLQRLLNDALMERDELEKQLQAAKRLLRDCKEFWDD